MKLGIIVQELDEPRQKKAKDGAMATS